MREAVELALRTARSLRLGMEAQGQIDLSEFVDALLPLLQRPEYRELSREIAPHLPLVLKAQERGDHLFVADLLEYAIGPTLARAMH